MNNTLGGGAMNVREIVKEWLEAHGYDGLYCGDSCCCENSRLLLYCHEECGKCVPGYKARCTLKCEHRYWRHSEPYGSWHIQGERQL